MDKRQFLTTLKDRGYATTQQEAITQMQQFRDKGGIFDDEGPSTTPPVQAQKQQTDTEQGRPQPIWGKQSGELVPENVGPYYKQGLKNITQQPFQTLFPGASSVQGKGIVPAVKRNVSAIGDVLGWPDRAIDFASGGAFERGQQTIGEAIEKIPGERGPARFGKDVLHAGAGMATSPSTYVTGGVLKKAFAKETPESITRQLGKRLATEYKPLSGQTGSVRIKSGKDLIPDVDDIERSMGSQDIMPKKIKYKDIKKQVGGPPKRGLRGSLIADDEAALLSQVDLPGETPFPDVLRQAHSAKINRLKGELTPFETASANKAIPALKKIDKLRKEAGKIKGDLVDNADEYLIATNQFIDATPVQQKFNVLLRDNFGAVINSKGQVVDAAGKAIKDSSDKLVILKMKRAIDKLRPESTLGEIDGVISDLRNMVEHQKVSQTRQMNTIAEGIGKNIRGDLKTLRNNAIENSVDWGGADQFLGKAGSEKLRSSLVNYERYIKLEDRLNRMLGQVTDATSGVPQKGASAMKAALVSNARGENKAVFEMVREITGIDLLKEAAKAEVAMKAVGDSRAYDLLKEAGVISSAARGDKLGILLKTGQKGIEKIVGEKPDQLLRYYYKMQQRGRKTTANIQPRPAYNRSFAGSDRTGVTIGELTRR